MGVVVRQADGDSFHICAALLMSLPADCKRMQRIFEGPHGRLRELHELCSVANGCLIHSDYLCSKQCMRHVKQHIGVSVEGGGCAVGSEVETSRAEHMY